jgi:hypothetical protein
LVKYFLILKKVQRCVFPTCAIAWSSAAVFSLQETPFLVQFVAFQIALMLVSRACLGKEIDFRSKTLETFFSRVLNKATRRKLTPPAIETKCFEQQNPAKKDKNRQGQFSPV